MSGEGSSWWSVSNNLWSKAKETGSYVYEFTAKDLGEVATSLKQDVIAPSASALKHKIQPHAQYGSLSDSVATMLGSVSDYLAPTDQQVTYLSRYGDDRLDAIQTDPKTYSSHVTDEHFTSWCLCFKLDEHTADISQLLVSNMHLRTLHTQLVPSEISYSNFWKVYYYRTELFHEEKRKHEELLARVGREEEEEDLGWGDEEDEDDITAGPSGIVQQTIEPNLKDELVPAKEEYSSMSSSVSEEDELLKKHDLIDTASDICIESEKDHVIDTDLRNPEGASVRDPEGSELGVTDNVLSLADESVECSLESSAVIVEIKDVIENDEDRIVKVENKKNGEEKGEESSDGSYEVIVKEHESPAEDDEFEKELDAMMLDMKEEENMGSDEGDNWEDWD